jgi:hypothetical protein
MKIIKEMKHRSFSFGEGDGGWGLMNREQKDERSVATKIICVNVAGGKKNISNYKYQSWQTILMMRL